MLSPGDIGRPSRGPSLQGEFRRNWPESSWGKKTVGKAKKRGAGLPRKFLGGKGTMERQRGDLVGHLRG